METITIAKTTLRRFILGKQGLWPGRRWTGKQGAIEAIQAIEAVQLDPLNVVARSQDIALWGRVTDYQQEYLNQAAYDERLFFDYGDSLFLYPMKELPFWRTPMRRCEETQRWKDFAAAHAELLDEVRAELHARGPLGNRDFTGRKRVHSYRGRKDTALALFYLWLTGEVMIHHRQGFERVYDFQEHIVPPSFNGAVAEDEAEDFFARKAIAFRGLATAREWTNSFSWFIKRPVSSNEAGRWLENLVEAGIATIVKIEHSKSHWYILSSDLPILSTLEEGNTPAIWKSNGITTETEAVLLAPLDIVSARGRARWVFDFEYVWEVYKPAATRRWGYYTLPILYGDRLAGRLDPKLDRSNATLQINGFWLEDDNLPDDAGFIKALADCLLRFSRFLKANRVDLNALQPSGLRKQVSAIIAASQDIQVLTEGQP